MDAACGHERALLAELAAQLRMPIVLFGPGNLGRRTLSPSKYRASEQTRTCGPHES